VKYFKRILLITLFVFFFCFQFLNPGLIWSVSEIETNYDFAYRVNPDGIVNVNQKISLTNKISAVYASQYSFALPSGNIKNIKATDRAGPCRIEIKQEKETTLVNVLFNEQILGAGKTLTFELNFDRLDLAQKDGEIWEIIIPKIGDLTNLNDYNLTLTVPQSFGQPAFIRPQPIEEKQEGGLTVYRFVKSQNIAGGVLATFGPFQIFDFTLFYHLQNPNFSLGETEIALPPDTAFQQITLNKVEPLPLNVRVDGDGNWLAKYQLGSKEKLDIVVTGQAKILAQPQSGFPQPEKSSLEKNLQTALFWEVDEPQIKKLAQELKTPRAIYDFVVKTLDYSFQRVESEPERLGALKALGNPDQAICMEFTDLFVTLARAAGIPSRAVDGFAYTDDSRLRPLSLMTDVLHVWPEYYDEEKNLWRPIDPTWGQTTGGIDYFQQTDLRHFAFAIHGEDSQTPYPAGSYKLPSTLGKDVQVTFGEYPKVLGLEDKDLDVFLSLPPKVFYGEVKKGSLLLKNQTPKAFYEIEIDLQTEGLNLLSSGHEKIKVLPPFGSKTIPIELAAKNFWGDGQGQVKAQVNEKNLTKIIEVGSLVEQILIPILGGALILGTLFLFLKKRF